MLEIQSLKCGWNARSAGNSGMWGTVGGLRDWAPGPTVRHPFPAQLSHDDQTSSPIHTNSPTHRAIGTAHFPIIPLPQQASQSARQLKSGPECDDPDNRKLAAKTTHRLHLSSDIPTPRFAAAEHDFGAPVRPWCNCIDNDTLPPTPPIKEKTETRPQPCRGQVSGRPPPDCPGHPSPANVGDPVQASRRMSTARRRRS